MHLFVLWKIYPLILAKNEIHNVYLFIGYIFLQSKKWIVSKFGSTCFHLWATQVKKREDHTSSLSLTACRQPSPQSQPHFSYPHSIGKVESFEFSRIFETCNPVKISSSDPFQIEMFSVSSPLLLNPP